MTGRVSTSMDIIDSRDVIERIEELEYLDVELEELEEEREDLAEIEEEIDDLISSEEYGELEALRELAEDCKDCAGWVTGTALIRESHFSKYVEDMLKDIGDLPRDLPWYIAIDWEQTAENIKQNYKEVDFSGVTYLIEA